jgi:ATP-dependent Clp protease protease subunit
MATKKPKKDDNKDDKKSGYKFDEKFIEQRKIFLWGAVNGKSAEKICNQLLYLEAEAPGKEITFFINSPGGVVTDGLLMMDVMNMITSPVRTVCMGMAASMGSILLAAGEKGKREIWPNARVMIHQPSVGGIQGQATDIEISAQQLLLIKQKSAHILADNCGKKYEDIMKDFDRDYWMDAKQALKYGIVDKISKKI